MKLEISLGPSGLLLHLPSGRTLEVSATPAGLSNLQRILREAEVPEPRRGYIGKYPTQAIVDAWLKEDHERKLEEAKEAREAMEREMGLDFDSLKISL